MITEKEINEVLVARLKTTHKYIGEESCAWLKKRKC